MRYTVTQRAQLIRQARRVIPRECCGIIASLDDVAMEILPVRNISSDDLLFEMDAREQYDAMVYLEGAGFDLGAIYHSHPAANAYPSSTDIAHAHYPEAMYIIISLAAVVPTLCGYRIVNKEVTRDRNLHVTL